MNNNQASDKLNQINSAIKKLCRTDGYIYIWFYFCLQYDLGYQANKNQLIGTELNRP